MIALKNALFLQTISAPELGSNVALWSLANEFWYYILFPLLIIAVWRGARGHWRIAAAAGAVLIAWLAGPSIAMYFSIWLLGVAVWYLPSVRARFSRPIGIASAAAFLFGARLVRHHVIGSQFESDVLLAVLFCGVLYAALQERQTMRPSLYQGIAHHAAAASYTLYLVHLPALVFLNAALAGVWHKWPRGSTHLATFAAISAFVLAYSYGVHFLFERNTDRVRRSIEALGRTREASREAFA
jgi:peptidoglycan/LPS O-acetylase OafA/YrhL